MARWDTVEICLTFNYRKMMQHKICFRYDLVDDSIREKYMNNNFSIHHNIDNYSSWYNEDIISWFVKCLNKLYPTQRFSGQIFDNIVVRQLFGYPELSSKAST